MRLDKIKVTNPYLHLPDECYAKVTPSGLNKPFLIHANKTVAKELTIDEEELKSETFLHCLNAQFLFKGSSPFAMCYAGHQFGHYVPRLGDGRAINIGTLNHLHLQLKGAGETRYSRMGDGRAVMRSSIREYLMSEAMFGLGIDTTRALGIIGSKHQVRRASWEYGAIVLRVSPSWIRFGTFEYFFHQKKYKELEALVEYTIAESYPHLIDKEQRYLLFFQEVVEKTAKLMAKWQAVGFTHGVMNTDNMSIAGLTLDYGPYAFLDDFHSEYVCNHTDSEGRYSFGNQPYIGEWNLQALKIALTPLIKNEKLDEAIANYAEIYMDAYLKQMSAKLGLASVLKSDDEVALLSNLLELLETLHVDYTLFFRTLSRYSGEREALLALGLYHQPMHEWLDSYDTFLCKKSAKEREKQMLGVNPKYVLKNYMLQEAITQANKGDFSLVETLFNIAQNPYIEHHAFEKYAQATPDVFKNKRLSCSS